MIVLALDALDYHMVRKYECEHLRQVECGRTDLSDFRLERTVVLWASFLTGRNMEAHIPIDTQWSYRVGVEDTFLRYFDSHAVVDLPAFSFKDENHSKQRRLLSNCFQNGATPESYEEYEAFVWKNHEENKKEFFASIGRFQILIGYFDLADAIGHLSFGISHKMQRVYSELDALARDVAKSTEQLLILSDHGMKSIGRFGDHSRNGFYSFNREMGLNMPKITDFYNMLISMIKKPL